MAEPHLKLGSERYKSVLRLPDFTAEHQEKLGQAVVSIVGAGGLGSPLALYLAGAGVGHITIIDDDNVSLDNLHRQIAFQTSDIGMPKAEVLGQKLQALNPNINITAHCERLDMHSAKTLIAEAHLVIDGSDNFETRFTLAKACHLASIPLLSGAVSGYTGELILLTNQGGPCYGCLYPDSSEAMTGIGCDQQGVLGPIAGTIATMMATHALRFLAGFDKPPVSRWFQYCAREASLISLPLAPQASCRICGVLPDTPDSAPGTPEGQPSCQVSADCVLTWLQEDNLTVYDIRSGQTSPVISDVSLVVRDAEALYQELSQPSNTEAKIVIACEAGYQSLHLVKALRKAGKDNVFSLQGGMQTLHNVLQNTARETLEQTTRRQAAES